MKYNFPIRTFFPKKYVELNFGSRLDGMSKEEQLKLEEVHERGPHKWVLVDIHNKTNKKYNQSFVSKWNKFNTKKGKISPEHIQWPKEVTNKAWVLGGSKAQESREFQNRHGSQISLFWALRLRIRLVDH